LAEEEELVNCLFISLLEDSREETPCLLNSSTELFVFPNDLIEFGFRACSGARPEEEDDIVLGFIIVETRPLLGR
jgi:hypothetical protein